MRTNQYPAVVARLALVPLALAWSPPQSRQADQDRAASRPSSVTVAARLGKACLSPPAKPRRQTVPSAVFVIPALAMDP
jgi:hypothetical protein